MQEAHRQRFPIDRAAALELIAAASSLVDEAIRRRPLFSGAAFTLPGHEEHRAT